MISDTAQARLQHLIDREPGTFSRQEEADLRAVLDVIGKVPQLIGIENARTASAEKLLADVTAENEQLRAERGEARVLWGVRWYDHDAAMEATEENARRIASNDLAATLVRCWYGPWRDVEVAAAPQQPERTVSYRDSHDIIGELAPPEHDDYDEHDDGHFGDDAENCPARATMRAKADQ